MGTSKPKFKNHQKKTNPPSSPVCENPNRPQTKSRVTLRSKIHHYGSIVFLAVVIYFLVFIPPTPINYKQVSIIKKRSEKIVISTWTESPLDFITPGYLVLNDDTRCFEMEPRPNEQTTVVLSNLQKNCGVYSKWQLAKKAGYQAAIFYNASHGVEKSARERKSFAIISNDEAAALRNYVYPKSFQFFVNIHSDQRKVKLQPLYERFSLFWVVTSSPDVLAGQGFIYGLSILIIWRLLLVEQEDSLIRLIMQTMLDSAKFSLRCVFFFIQLSIDIFNLVINMLFKIANWPRLLISQAYTYITIRRIYNEFISPQGTYGFLRKSKPIPLSVFLSHLFQRMILRRNVSKRTGPIMSIKRDPQTESILSLSKKIHHDPIAPVVSRDNFKESHVLGYGGFGKVTKELFKRRNQTFAMKSVRLDLVRRIEADIMACGNLFDGLVPLIYGFTSSTHAHFVMELMEANLAQVMDKLNHHHARIYAVQLGLAIDVLHVLGIAHLDIKPANVMLTSNYHIKLGDFGTSQRCKTNECVETLGEIGTRLYMAPEGRQPGQTEQTDQTDQPGKTYLTIYTQASDWWAYGCILFELFHPRHETFINTVSFLDNIKKRVVSAGAVDYRLRQVALNMPIQLNKCLDVKPENRKPLADRDDGIPMRFSDFEELGGIPINMDPSVNIRDHYPFDLEFDRVAKPVALAPPRDGVNPEWWEKYGEFYFDYQDVNCYRNNSVIFP